MIAFAANSVLTRLALAPGLVDPASFATLRIVSGAVFLALLIGLSSGGAKRFVWRPKMALALFVYVIGFTFAYLTLDAGVGALVLFGAVQITMLLYGFLVGERLSLIAWAGLSAAALGVIILIAPGDGAINLVGFLSMAIAGIAWGVYSLQGRGVSDPLGATAGNFILCAPLVMLVSVFFIADMDVTIEGAVYAVLSGAIASGAGYALWYAALRSLEASIAATVQLTVPVIAAVGGVIFLSEDVTIRLAIASVLTLGGVAVVLWSRVK